MASSSFYSATGVTPDNPNVEAVPPSNSPLIDPVAPLNINAIESSVANAKASEDAAAASANSIFASAATATAQANGASNSATLTAGYKDTALTQAGISTTKAGEAAASETAAAGSASTASTQAGIATTKASEAVASASASAISASSANASKDAALAALDSFDDRYLGQKSADVTVDNDGNALVSGSLYFNTTNGVMMVFEGSSWVAAYTSISNALITTSNLSDVDNAGTARTNLGLAIGTNVQAYSAVLAATTASYTTAEETKLADIEAGADVTDTANVVAALTAGSNITIATNGTIAGSAQYTHPTHAGDDASVDTGALSGATVISDLDFNITTDTLGHVTDANATVSTRDLTLANLGYTGATNANYITNNNQLTNGAGYTTNVGDITGVTAGSNLTGGGTSGTLSLALVSSPSFSGTVSANAFSGDGSALTGIGIETARSNATSGYVKYSNGIIFQWNRWSYTHGYKSFPLTFPNACTGFSYGINTGWYEAECGTAQGASSYETHNVRFGNNASRVYQGNMFAIGY